MEIIKIKAEISEIGNECTVTFFLKACFLIKLIEYAILW